MVKRYIWFLVAMILLTPLGMLAEGTAWGEWGSEELQTVLGYVPQGVVKVGGLWNAWLPDYSLEALGTGKAGGIAGYLLSAIIGSLLSYCIVLLLVKPLAQQSKDRRKV
ncbi:PDGLE domain-containing protein [Propionispora hippei]|uniref:Cobalt/nickel transport protein n=1 Tax=Propionispora hippei DSM 15287 TaxID=1123003 RepID=A0A1M6IAC0_9FIRM|nr:PDGLE domain-containing protein [Propionispora hippei]SHJ31308.1 cobalt/nickel transport protein [Propionispora hippei DSM 15287]